MGKDGVKATSNRAQGWHPGHIPLGVISNICILLNASLTLSEKMVLLFSYREGGIPFTLSSLLSISMFKCYQLPNTPDRSSPSQSESF